MVEVMLESGISTTGATASWLTGFGTGYERCFVGSSNDPGCEFFKQLLLENQLCCTSTKDLFKDALLRERTRRKIPALGRIRTHHRFIERHVLSCCATTTGHIVWVIFILRLSLHSPTVSFRSVLATIKQCLEIYQLWVFSKLIILSF